MVGIVSTGIGSGLDVSGLVTQLVAAEAQPAQLRFARKEAGVLAQISGYSALKSALSAFRTEAEKLQDADKLLGRTVKFEENDFFTVSVSDSASPAEFDLDVIALASAQKLASSAFVSTTSVVGDGQLTISSGENSFVIAIDPEANTVADIQDAINNSADNTSVRATLVTTDAGVSLSLSSLSTGTDSKITVVSSGGDGGLSVLDYDSVTDTGSLTEVRAASDAQVEIDGLLVTSSDNTIKDAIDGVTINLTAADPGVLRNVSVDFDREGLNERLQNFVNSYNNLVDVFSTQTSFDEESNSAGALLGDTTLRNIESQLRREFSNSVKDSGLVYKSLSEIGFSLDIEGKVSLDAERLNDAIDEGFLQVGNLFTSENGIAASIENRLSEYLSDEGPITTRSDGLQATIDDINEQRERLGERLVILEARFLRQFNALDSLVSQLSNTSNFLSQQLSNLPGAQSQI